MHTEIYLTTFGPEDEMGYRQCMDHYQIPDRGSWEIVRRHVRAEVGRDGVILMYKATCDESRKIISVSATPWRIR